MVTGNVWNVEMYSHIEFIDLQPSIHDRNPQELKTINYMKNDAKQVLNGVFPKKNVTIIQNGAKVNIKKLNSEDLKRLYGRSKGLDVEVRRSGDGLVIEATSQNI